MTYELSYVIASQVVENRCIMARQMVRRHYELDSQLAERRIAWSGFCLGGTSRPRKITKMKGGKWR